LQFEYIACSRKGEPKDKNEDCVMVNKFEITRGYCIGKTDKIILAIICDGVGSTKGADIASKKIINYFKRLEEKELVSPRIICKHLFNINKEILDSQKKNGNNCDMASTVAGLLVSNNRYITFNIGDTRIYKFYRNNMTCISRDHVIINLQKNTLYGYLGGDGYGFYPSIQKGKIENGSIFILCSDGVYNCISEMEMVNILGSNNELIEKGRAIIEKVFQNGSKDDTSLIVIDCSILN